MTARYIFTSPPLTKGVLMITVGKHNSVNCLFFKACFTFRFEQLNHCISFACSRLAALRNWSNHQEGATSAWVEANKLYDGNRSCVCFCPNCSCQEDLMSLLITIPGLYKYIYTHTHMLGRNTTRKDMNVSGSPSHFDPSNPVFVPIIPLRLSDYLLSLFPSSFGSTPVLKPNTLGCILCTNMGF